MQRLILKNNFWILLRCSEIDHLDLTQPFHSFVTDFNIGDYSFFVPLKSMVKSLSESCIGCSNALRSGSFCLRSFGLLPLVYRLLMPSNSSIMCSIWFWSDESIGAMEMSRTALNLPQLFKCSFSKRKKFHTNRRNTSSGAKIDVRKSPEMYFDSVKMKPAPHAKRSTKSSMIAK